MIRFRKFVVRAEGTPTVDSEYPDGFSATQRLEVNTLHFGEPECMVMVMEFLKELARTPLDFSFNVYDVELLTNAEKLANQEADEQA